MSAVCVLYWQSPSPCPLSVFYTDTITITMSAVYVLYWHNNHHHVRCPCVLNWHNHHHHVRCLCFILTQSITMTAILVFYTDTVTITMSAVCVLYWHNHHHHVRCAQAPSPCPLSLCFHTDALTISMFAVCCFILTQSPSPGPLSLCFHIDKITTTRSAVSVFSYWHKHYHVVRCPCVYIHVLTQSLSRGLCVFILTQSLSPGPLSLGFHIDTITITRPIVSLFSYWHNHYHHIRYLCFHTDIIKIIRSAVSVFSSGHNLYYQIRCSCVLILTQSLSPCPLSLSSHIDIITNTCQVHYIIRSAVSLISEYKYLLMAL